MKLKYTIMLKKIFSTILVTVFCSITVQTIYAQGIGINETGATPDPSAILDASSTDKGLLGPRMTTAQRDNISSPAIGLQIFNLDTDCVEVFFANGGWLPIRCGCSSFPDATFPNPGGAANVPVNFDANTVVSTNSYNWIFDQGTPSSSADTSETVTWTTADTYEVTLIVSDENNCVSTHTENVVIIPCASFPDATFTGSNGSINSPIAFSANGSGAGYTYDWTFPSGTPSTSTQQNPTVEWTTDGTYTVELTVTDNLSCSASETMEVTVDLCTPDGPWNFTNAGATGTMGPTQTQVNTAYSTTNLDGDVISNSGIQQWTVPSTGTYRISVAGAQGGNSNNNSGGLGSELQGDFTFTAGQEINILVGQGGETGVNGTTSSAGGGGGGTFVLENSNLLLAAGGGGGAIESARGNENGGDALVTLTGGNSSVIGNYGLDAPGVGGGTRASGGTDGYGGGGGIGAGGGGFSGDGGEPQSSSAIIGNGYLNNGNGGSGGGSNTDGNGGFGGGGGATAGAGAYGGGGGGYSGGGGGGWTGNTTLGSAGNGGGGGSINNGINQTNTAGANTGHGYVTIEKVCP